VQLTRRIDWRLVFGADIAALDPRFAVAVDADDAPARAISAGS
jgi:hypothetical protein